MELNYSKSYGDKRAYFQKGYRDEGWLIGFNTRLGGRSLWIKP